MRSFLLIASALVAFATTLTVETTDANAVVCARGVYRAGCAGTRGAVVVRRPAVVAAPVVVAPVAAPVVVAPVVACRTVWVDGVRVRRCR